jgi:hypothetical protein
MQLGLRAQPFPALARFLRLRIAEPMLDERADFGMKNPKHQHPQMFTPRVKSDFGGGD